MLNTRQDVSKRIDAAFNTINKRVKCSFNSNAAISFEASIDGMVTQLATHGIWAFTAQGAAFEEAHVAGYREAAKECRNTPFILDTSVDPYCVLGKRYLVSHEKAESVAIHNSIKDVARKAADTLKSLFTKFGDTLKAVVRKVMPERDMTKKPLTKREIAKMEAEADKVIEKYKKYANTVVQDELTKVHADGKLDAYQKAGVQQLMVKICTVKDDRRCKKCTELEGKLFPIEVARGLLPMHFNCRCIWKFPSQKGVTKPLRLEQKQQERKAMKFRERLDRKYKQKQAEKAANKGKKKTVAVHNAQCDCHVCVFNQNYAESMLPLQSDHYGYGIIPVENIEVGSYHVLVKPIKYSAKRKGKSIIIFDTCLDQDVLYDINECGIVPTGALVKLENYNARTNEWQWRVVGTMLPIGVTSAEDEQMERMIRHRVHSDWQKRVQKYGGKIDVISLLPESIHDYPYCIAEQPYGKGVSAVMINPNKGYFEIMGVRTGLLDFNEILERILKGGFQMPCE